MSPYGRQPSVVCSLQFSRVCLETLVDLRERQAELAREIEPIKSAGLSQRGLNAKSWMDESGASSEFPDLIPGGIMGSLFE